MDARLQKSVDDAAAVENLQDRRLDGGPARLMVRRRPALDDSRPHAVAEKLAGGEQARRAGPHDQDFRRGFGLIDAPGP